jgi:hypothetical protein
MQEIDEYEQEEIRAEALAGALREGGLSASAEDTGGGILCVIVDRSDGGQIIWGTADVNWGATIQDAEGDIHSRRLLLPPIQLRGRIKGGSWESTEWTLRKPSP